MNRAATQESRSVQAVLIVLTIGLLVAFLLLPLVVVFTQALKDGLAGVLDALSQPDALAAIRLTLLVAAISVAVPTKSNGINVIHA